MKTIETNTDLLPNRTKPDTYNTYVWHEMFDIEYEANEMQINVDDIGIDHDAFKNDLASWLTDYIIEETRGGVLPSWIRFSRPKQITVVSPRYYNYGTDSMNINIVYDEVKLKEFIEKEKEELNKYLERFESRSGFISFTPSSYYELINEEDEERVVCCVMCYLLDKIEIDSPRMSFDYGIVYNNLLYPNDKE